MTYDAIEEGKRIEKQHQLEECIITRLILFRKVIETQGALGVRGDIGEGIEKAEGGLYQDEDGLDQGI